MWRNENRAGRASLLDNAGLVTNCKTPPDHKIWQDENHDHLIRNEKDYYEKLQYILYNAVKDGLAASPFDYPWSYCIGRPE